MPARQILRARSKQMVTWHPEILITTAPLESRPNNWNGGSGATVDFWGVVRAQEEERQISGIEYETHQAMAQHQLELIARAARAEFDLQGILLHHRIGFVAAGQASLFLRVTSVHRAAAYQASAWIVAELKQKVPIWKRPVFVRREHATKTE